MEGKKLTYALSSAGLVGGIWFAYKRNSGFWGYVGFALLGSIAGSAVGMTIDAMTTKTKTTTTTVTTKP